MRRGIGGVCENLIWAVSTISSAVNVKQLFTDLDFGMRVD